MSKKSITFVVDDKEVKTINIDSYSLPISTEIPINGGMQLKIICKANETINPWQCTIGVGNIVVR